MARFKRRPVEIEARQLRSGAWQDIREWCKGCIIKDGNRYHAMHLSAHYGVMNALSNDWVIKDADGEFYSCKPDIFAKTYELVE